MTGRRAQRRPRGTGSLYVRADRWGRRTWYGKWRQGGRQVKRALGPVRKPGDRVGLGRREAETELRRKLAEADSAGRIRERVDLAEAGDRYLSHIEHFRGRKRSTVQDYGIILNRHLVAFFGRRSLEAIDRSAVESYQQAKLAAGLSPKTVANHVRFLHGLYRYAVGRQWAARNPVAGIEHPRRASVETTVRALSVAELETLLHAVPSDALGDTDRVLYVTAAMTGLRKGELQGLRWEDIDWPAGVVRVRRTYSRGELTAPKSSRSVRAVPLPDRVAQELANHHVASGFRSDQDLVFCHPQTGGPYDASKISRRFKAALRMGGLRDGRFHDLRHTFGTQMAAAGAPLRFVQEWMGHRDYKTTSIYAAYAADASQGRCVCTKGVR